MTTVPLGIGAYERISAGAPEIVLQNRWAEKAPSNLREHVLLLSRPGTTPQLAVNALSQGSFAGLGPMRGNYWFGGLFADSLFVVCGSNLYRIRQGMSVTHISGTINGTGVPQVAWMKGAGYEYLFIADGLLLQVYTGTTHASGTLTLSGTITNGVDQFQVGGVYYTWGTSFSGSDNGTSAHPYVVNPLSDALGQLVKAVNDSGTPGTDYSATISGPNTLVSATENGGPPGTSVTFTALAEGTGGNSISTTVTGGTHLTFGAATLQNGGTDALAGVTVPGGLAANALTQVSSFVLVSVSGSQEFFWIEPGALSIDALDFATKESSPDVITAMRSVGDQAIIMGEASTENWYATGDLNAPFSPIEGRVYQRGAVAGTSCVVSDAVMLVGDDGVAYQIGYQFGTGSDWGVHRISNHGIEERIRRQIRRQAGLTP